MSTDFYIFPHFCVFSLKYVPGRIFITTKSRNIWYLVVFPSPSVPNEHKHQSPHRICGDCKHIYHISYTYITNQTVTADCFQSYHQVYQVQTAYQLQIVQSLPAVLDHPLIKTLHLLQQSQLTLQQLLLPWR